MDDLFPSRRDAITHVHPKQTVKRLLLSIRRMDRNSSESSIEQKHRTFLPCSIAFKVFFPLCFPFISKCSTQIGTLSLFPPFPAVGLPSSSFPQASFSSGA